MAYLRDTAIVLLNEPYREHDSWLTMYGKTHGKLIAVARGSRRWQAKQGGHLEPFSEIEVMIAHGQAFDKLAVATTVSVRHALRQRLSGLVIAGVISRLIERLTHPGASDVTVYGLLLELLNFTDDLQAEPTPERARLIVASITLRLLDTLGYALQLEQCVVCQKALTEPVWFFPEAGGMICAVCMKDRARSFFQAVRLPDLSLRLLRFMRHSDLPNLARLTISIQLLQAVSLVIDRCVEHHAPLLPRRTPQHDSTQWLQLL